MKKSKYQQYINREIAQGPPDPIEILNRRVRQTIERCPTCELDPENGIPNDLCSSCAEEVGRFLTHESSRLGRMVVNKDYLGWMEPNERLQCLQDVRENFRRMAWEQAHDLQLVRTVDFVNQHPMVALLDIEIDRQRRAIEEGRKATKRPGRKRKPRTIRAREASVTTVKGYFKGKLNEKDMERLHNLLLGARSVLPQPMKFDGSSTELRETLGILYGDGLLVQVDSGGVEVGSFFPKTALGEWGAEHFEVRDNTPRREWTKPKARVLRQF